MPTNHHSPRVQCTASMIEDKTRGVRTIHHCDFWSHTSEPTHKCDCGYTWVEALKPVAV